MRLNRLQTSTLENNLFNDPSISNGLWNADSYFTWSSDHQILVGPCRFFAGRPILVWLYVGLQENVTKKFVEVVPGISFF